MGIRVLVTGAAGLYGLHLVYALLKHDSVETVVGVDNLSRTFLSPNPVEGLAGNDRFTFIRADFRDLSCEAIDQWQVDVVVHLAARVSIDESMVEPDLYIRENELGTIGLGQALLRSRGRPTLIYASSPEVYGKAMYRPIDEDHPLNPCSVYAATKLAAEKHLHALYEWHGYPVVVLRNFNTFGPNQNTDAYAAVIPAFIGRALRGEPLVIHGDGKQTRDFQWVGDAVGAYVRAIERREALVGRTINIGSGREVGILELAQTVLQLTGSSSPVMHVPARPGDLPALRADVRCAREMLGWQAATPFEEGLERTIEWLRGALQCESS